MTTLVAFQLLAGVPLCQERGDALGAPAGSLAVEQTAGPHDHEGGAHHHDHAGENHRDCIETFLPTARGFAPACATVARVSTAKKERVPFPTYDVPTPVPIVPSFRAPNSKAFKRP